MNDPRSLGRAVGAAMAGSFVIELLSNFQLQEPLLGRAAFLEVAGRHPLAVGSLILLGLLAGLLSLFSTAVMARLYLQRQPLLVWSNLALTVVALAASLVELSSFHTMRALSEQYLQAGPDAAARFEPSANVVRLLRAGVHFSTKTLEGVEVLAFFALLWAVRGVPRALAGAGMAAALLQMAAVSRPLFGQEVIFPLLAPLGLVYLATFLWLLAKGLPDQAGA